MSEDHQSIEPMRGYELRRMFEGLAALIERTPGMLSRELDQVCDGAIEDVTARITRVMEACKAFEVTLHNKGEEMCNLCDELYQKVKSRHEKLRKQLTDLPELPNQNVNWLNYETKQICELAERYSHLTPEQWAKVVELANVLKR